MKDKNKQKQLIQKEINRLNMSISRDPSEENFNKLEVLKRAKRDLFK
jgi:hypothetical protein